MDKKEAFKIFIKSKPKLLSYIKENENAVQKLYEVYDLYGEDDDVWNKYMEERSININNITDIVKSIDINSIKGHIDTAQKALNIVQELTSKAGSTIKDVKKPLAPKPLNKFFED